MLITIQPVVTDAYYLKTPLLDSFKAWNNVCRKSKWLILIFKPSFYPSLDIVTLNILERYNKQEIFNQSINQSIIKARLNFSTSVLRFFPGSYVTVYSRNHVQSFFFYHRSSLNVQTISIFCSITLYS